MRDRDEDLTWRVRGVCQSVDPEVFFPAPSEPADAAVALCRTCDVQGACLAWALEVGDCHGVWGATTPRERRAMLVAWHSEEVQSQLRETGASQRAPASEERTAAPAWHGRETGASQRAPASEERTAAPAWHGRETGAARPVMLPMPRIPVRELAPTA
jgi:hypothetical protein